MSENLFIGVDIGTQGVKAAIYDAQGRCHAEAFRKSDLHRPGPGVVEEDPELQVRSTCEVISEVVQKAAVVGSVKGLSIDGQMAGIIGVGENGRNVTPYDSWLDTRCLPYIVKMHKEAGAEIARKTGGPPSFNHGPKILWWKHERPEDYKRIAAFVQPGGYAVMRLCGLDGTKAFIDRSYLHFSGFADARAGAWDQKLCKRFGVDPAKLPRMVFSHEIMGQVTAEMAAACGIPAGTPVAAGCGDTAASFLSSGATRSGVCVDVAGTASVFAATTPEFQADEKELVLGCGRSASPKLWHPYAYINGGGMNLEWFRETIASAFAAAGAAPVDFEKLNAMAEAVTPAEDDPFFIPHLGGRMSPSQPLMRGAWVGLTWSHGPGHLFRAVLEGVALEYGIYLKTVERLFGKGSATEVRITGGGEKSAVWNRIKADTLQCPVVQVMGSGGAPLGSALLAAHAAGAVKSLDEGAATWIKTGAVTEPDAHRAAACRARVERYASLMRELNGWFEAGTQTK
jgi:xylulokinase